MNKLTHQVRVEEETNQLQHRLADLRNFFLSQTFAWLTPTEQGLLKEQEGHMAKYLDVLYRRLNFWQQSHEPA